MFLDIFSKDGKRYIRISENVRVEVDGKRIPRKKTIASIGPVSKFDDGKPNFEQRLRDSFKACDPIIIELKPYVKKELPKEIYNLKIHEGTDECIGHPKLFASSLFDYIMDSIDLRQFVGTYKNYDGINFDVLGFMKLAIYGRILNPASKISTVKQNGRYYSPILSKGYYDFNIYDMLDFVAKHKKAIFNRIDSKMREKYRRTTKKIYYDVTNFFFEIDEQDRTFEEDGTITITGYRQHGVSKEHREQPIVQMGLLMDEQGYPISIETFNGNTLDHLTFKPSIESSPNCIQESRYIFVSDKGIGPRGNTKYAIENGNGYITSKSVKGSTKEEKEWITNQNGYSYIGEDFKYKSRVVVKTYKLDNGTEIKSSEKQVTYWSKNFFDKEYHEKKEYYDFLKELISNPNNFRITNITKNVIRKYFKKDLINIKTGELISMNDLSGIIDFQKVKEEYSLLGYYTLITSETNMEATEVIDTYHQLVQIEDEFRIMKSTLETRPIFVRTNDHILAHLTLCTISLLLIRIIQNKVKDNYPDLFNTGELMSAQRIRQALNKLCVEKLSDEYYRFNDIDDSDVKLILSSFGIHIEPKLYRIGDLKHIKSAMK